MPVLHFCDEGQRAAFVIAMAIHKISDETLGGQGLSDLPGQRDMRIIIYKLLEDKTVATVTQLPGYPLHESMNTYTEMLRGQGMKTPHPMIPEYHEYLGRYLGMNIRTDDAFMARIYLDHPQPHAAADDREPLQRRRRVNGEYRGRVVEFPMPPPQEMVQMALAEFGILNVFFGGGDGVDLSAPGRVDEKPAPQEVVPLEEAWEQLLGKPEKIAGVPDCSMCCEYSATIALVPCGHRLGCDDCFRKLMKTSTLTKVCPTCREDFKTIVKVRD